MAHKKRWGEGSETSRIYFQPLRFFKKFLGDKRGGQLECTKELKRRRIELNNNPFIISLATQSIAFNSRVPCWSEIQEVIKASRSTSAPGPSCVPYIVYKRCPNILRRLWRILWEIWPRNRVADQWRYSEGMWTPKEENSKEIEQFRFISLFDTECKLFFSILSHRLTRYIKENEYIDKSVQKGGVPGIPDCIEHTGVVKQLLKEGKEKKGDLGVLWLNLANAYGCIPHKLIEEAHKRYPISSETRKLLRDYYATFYIKTTAGVVSSGWHRLERDVITGCSVLMILFTITFMLIKSAEVECRGPLMKAAVRQPPIMAYIDNLTV